MKFAWLILLLPFYASGQTRNEDISDNISENIVSGTDNDDSTPETIDNYAQLIAHALDLNTASAGELRMLNVFSENQIVNLLRHRELNGELLSIHELQTIDGFDPETIRLAQRTMFVRPKEEGINRSILRRARYDAENYLMLRTDISLERKRGFTNQANESQRFIGDPRRIAMRLRSYRPGDFSFGITTENDPGERMRWSPRANHYGFDHIVWHAQVQNKGRVKNLVVGNYAAQFAQGLVYGGNIGFGKGAETILNVRRPNAGFVPFTSMWESGYYNGIASTIKVSRYITLSTMYSSSRRDGANSEEEDDVVASIQTTGLHRNATELSRRKTLNESVSGAVIQFDNDRVSAGFTFQDIRFGARIQPRSRLYNYHAFSGNTMTNIGGFFTFTVHNVSLFHESATTLQGGMAMVTGSLISLDKNFDLALLHRTFSQNYFSRYANAFSENTEPRNESGVYWGWRYKFPRKIVWSGYVDLFRFPGLKFRTYAPSTGYEWLMRAHWQLTKTTSAFVQARCEEKYRNANSNDFPLHTIAPIRKNNYWVNLDYAPGSGLRMKTRFQWSTFHSSVTTSGYTLLQDVSIQKSKFRFTGRYALFQTDDYDNRQYVYEHDVWLAYSMPAYHGTGIRKYLLIQYNAGKRYTFWVRYGHTRFVGRESIGSGIEMIRGDQQNDIKFEMRIRFR